MAILADKRMRMLNYSFDISYGKWFMSSLISTPTSQLYTCIIHNTLHAFCLYLFDTVVFPPTIFHSIWSLYLAFLLRTQCNSSLFIVLQGVLYCQMTSVPLLKYWPSSSTNAFLSSSISSFLFQNYSHLSLFQQYNF